MGNAVKQRMEHPTVFDASEVQIIHWEVPAQQRYASQLYDEGEAFKTRGPRKNQTNMRQNVFLFSGEHTIMSNK